MKLSSDSDVEKNISKEKVFYRHAFIIALQFPSIDLQSK